MIVRPAIRFIAIGLLAGLAGLAGAALADGPPTVTECGLCAHLSCAEHGYAVLNVNRKGNP